MSRYPKQISGPAPIPNELMKRLSGLSDKDWGRRTNDIKAFKSAIKAYLYKEQGYRCAYCGYPFSLASSSHGIHIDHIAPKEKYSDWTFDPKNLVVSCSSCNSSCKGKMDPIIPPAGNDCLQCSYKIIHPYMEEFNDFIDWPYDSYPLIREGLNRSQHDKAEKTINLFRLRTDYKVCRRNIYHTCTNLRDSLSISSIIEYMP